MARNLFILAIFLLLAVPAGADSYTPAEYDLTVTQGEDFVKTLRVTDGSGAVLNLTGYAFQAQARQSWLAPVMLNFSAAVNAGAGTVALHAKRTLTSPLGGKSGFWDVLMTLPDGSKSYLLKGKFKVSPTVTR